MNKSISLGLTITLMAISAAITFIISTSYSMNIYNDLVADVQERAEMYQKLEQIDTYVRAYYDGTIDEDKLIEALANGYISIIEDADASYLTSREYTLFREHLSGTHLGIGIYTKEEGGYPVVTEVLANSPASTAGIAVGESIIEINGQSCLELGYAAAYDLLRSAAGTPLELTLQTGGLDRKTVVSTIQMTTATVSSRKIGDLGYIKITQFNQKTYQQFMASYSAMMSQGAKGLIIDVRNSQSHYFDPAVNILAALMPIDTSVAVKVSKDGSESVYETANGSRAATVPITVLVNSRTTGASELFAVSLKDSYGAAVVGTTTSGDGDLFETYPLYDGTAIVLPIATLKTVNYEFDGVGVKPDYDVAVVYDDTNEELSKLDEITDAALKRAIEVVTSQIPAEE